ncbi:MAG: aminotransferase [Acidimicrobiia bacterium]|nr:aminotransferase [Acidimicrobiia bacterium]
MSHAQLFSRFLGDGRMHFAAHSHHPWPDVTFDAHRQAWLDAAESIDDKWQRVMEEVVPEAQGHITRQLGLPDPGTIAFAPNTHELVNRLASALPSPIRILTTDGEFHSFRRQGARWEETRRAAVTRIPVEPFDTFPYRFLAAAEAREHDLTYLSQVFFDSGYAVSDLAGMVLSLPLDGEIVIDGYHGFMAVPTLLGPVAGRVFYLAGGYKYAMAGEGACFMHCPEGRVRRPVDTGWYAEFDQLEGDAGTVGYPTDAGRFWGATFDPSGLYRFNAVQRLLDERGITVAAIHAHVEDLQRRFLAAGADAGLDLGELIPEAGSFAVRGHFLTFRGPQAAGLAAALAQRGVTVDRRADRLRIGFGIYHSPQDVERLVDVLDDITTTTDPKEAAR